MLEVGLMKNREEMEQLVAEYLYGEISDSDRDILMAWLKEHPDEQQEMDELRSVMTCLNTLKTEASQAEPLRLYDVTGLPKKPVAWRRWITAAAACLVAVICVSQGLVIQVGSTRIALGPQVNLEPQTDTQQNHDDEVIPVLLKSVQSLQASNNEMLLRQSRLETGLTNLSQNQSQFQTELALYNQKQFEQFAGEFVDVMDQKLRYLMPVSFIPANYQQTNIDETSNQ
jgi:protein involved in sex pheromone biosynthesis